MSSLVDVTTQGRVATFSLNRPHEMNALSTALLTELADAFRAAASDEVGVIVLAAHGRAFCAGADLSEARALSTDVHGFVNLVANWGDTFAVIEQCPKPVIGAVHGLAVAGGLELALCCDFIVAAESARLGDGHINFGLVPGGGGSRRLPRAVGVRQARRLMYSGSLVTAHEALQIGLVQQVLPDDTFATDVAELAATMARRSPPALAFMKRMTVDTEVTEEALRAEALAAAVHTVAPDAQEGLAAFGDKREPRFPSLTKSR